MFRWTAPPVSWLSHGQPIQMHSCSTWGQPLVALPYHVTPLPPAVPSVDCHVGSHILSLQQLLGMAVRVSQAQLSVCPQVTFMTKWIWLLQWPVPVYARIWLWCNLNSAICQWHRIITHCVVWPLIAITVLERKNVKFLSVVCDFQEK